MLIVAIRDRSAAIWGPLRVSGALSLAIYMIGFSLAYVSIDSGMGALILFGGVQVTMFAGGLLLGEQIPARRWAGAAMALIGLIWLLWPSEAIALNALHTGLMLLAALGWGIYSLVGQRAGEPVRASASNFLIAAPLCFVITMLMPAQIDAVPMTQFGIVLALVSGVVTSALAYALWYAILPQLSASVAGTAMVTPPVIAMLGGMIILGEAVTGRFILASALVLGGVLLGVLGSVRGRVSRV